MNRRATRIPLTSDRRLVCDVIDLARKTPTASVHCEIDVSEIKRLRRQIPHSISWQVIMMRAYGIVSKLRPELRQIYSPCPKPKLYQHPESVCLLTIAREHLGRERLFFVRFCQPEHHSLVQLQARFDYYRKTPIKQIRHLRHQLRFASVPWPFRMACWSLLNQWMPASKARQMGTFGMSLSSFRHVRGIGHLSPCTTTLGYDQLCRKGKAYVTLTFDHRILDGKPAVDVLCQLESVLKKQVADELQMIARSNSDLTKVESAVDPAIFEPGHDGPCYSQGKAA